MIMLKASLVRLTRRSVACLGSYKTATTTTAANEVTRVTAAAVEVVASDVMIVTSVSDKVANEP